MIKNTISFSFFLLAFLCVKFNILLLNEESLILIVFIVFCTLCTIRLRESVKSYFELQIKSIKESLFYSNSKLKDSFILNKKNLKISTNWSNEFNNLKIHFKDFNKFILLNWTQFYKVELIQKIEKKLLFSQRLENQLLKLVTLIVVEKVKKIFVIKNFCNSTLHLKKFQTSEKIYFREHLKKIY